MMGVSHTRSPENTRAMKPPTGFTHASTTRNKSRSCSQPARVIRSAPGAALRRRGKSGRPRRGPTRSKVRVSYLFAAPDVQVDGEEEHDDRHDQPNFE